jgi:hypothetical protein
VDDDTANVASQARGTATSRWLSSHSSAPFHPIISFARQIPSWGWKARNSRTKKAMIRAANLSPLVPPPTRGAACGPAPAITLRSARAFRRTPLRCTRSLVFPYAPAHDRLGHHSALDDSGLVVSTLLCHVPSTGDPARKNRTNFKQREWLGEIVAREHPPSIAHRAPMANGQERMTFARIIQWIVIQPTDSRRKFHKIFGRHSPHRQSFALSSTSEARFGAPEPLSQLAGGQSTLILTVRATVTQLATSPVKLRP